MAIRRCPYCKAIIDEGSEYCSNCGTQLIFPEDEFVEEEIPGEKIIDVNEEDVDVSEEGNPEKQRDQTIKRKKRKGKEAKEVEKGEAEVIEEESEAVEKGIEESEAEPVEIPEEEEITEQEEERSTAYMQEDDFADSPSEELLELNEDLFPKMKDEAEEGVEGAEERASEEVESADFRTADLEGMVDPAEKEREEIERFLDSLKEEREKTKKYYEETGELPPWAQSMREKVASESLLGKEEEFDEEPIEPLESGEVDENGGAAVYEESFKEELEESLDTEEFKEPDREFQTRERETGDEDTYRATDTGMGLPEGVDQQSLPFGRGLFESTIAKEKRRPLKKPDAPFSPWIKSRIFDLLIVVGAWLVALWLASRVAGIGFFRLITTSAVQTLVFLVILLVIYFFLFLFFLGETLGDHLFSEES